MGGGKDGALVTSGRFSVGSGVGFSVGSGVGLCVGSGVGLCVRRGSVGLSVASPSVDSSGTRARVTLSISISSDGGGEGACCLLNLPVGNVAVPGATVTMMVSVTFTDV